jgi:sarcosine oxidase subunit alpha
MSAPFRTLAGGRVDRARTVEFTFDGRTYHGLEGDTLASALLANGVRLVGRSFKYHRPRGLLSAGSDEPNALVALRRDAARYTPNLRATEVELYDGLAAESQNRWPSLALDLGAVNGLLAPFLSAGFYYKTFMWPPKAWDRLYEPLIRRAAGLGRSPTEPDPDLYLHRYAHCEVLVVGAGPAGLAAALAAAETGVRVMLVDEQAALGGSLLSSADETIDGQPAAIWLAATVAALAAKPNVVLLPRTIAFGYFPHNMIGLVEKLSDHLAASPPGQPRERLWQVRAKAVVLAAGAHERPLVFPDNDRPGVMLAGAARTYLNRYGVKPGRRVVIATGHDGAYRAALDLHRAGVEIAAVADVRPDATGPLVQAAQTAGLPIRRGCVITGVKGVRQVRGARLSTRDGHGAFASEIVACDAVLMSGGFTPSVHLFSQSRGKLVWDSAIDAYLPGEAAERTHAAGACRGRFGLADALEDGWAVGAAAAGRPQERAFAVQALEAGAAGVIGALPHDRGGRPKAFVDWQNDVVVSDLKLAVREGFRSIEHIKRYTTTGMATDQGKTSNINALGVVSDLLDTPVPAIGLTTFRMPYTPISFGAMAGFARGDLFDPVRTTPMHDWAVSQGAVFEDVSLWKRARYFPEMLADKDGEDMEAAVRRECLAVRNACGVFDASTLGKIEVVGPDAAEFLNRLYVNPWTRLAVGRCRYGVLCREDGFVMDDGVVGRLALDRFHVTTSTGNAARVLAMMEDYLQTEWSDLRVWLTSTTEQWAVVALQGPNAREILGGLVEGVDLSPQALPHMGLTEGRILGVPMRLFRVSFTGELGFEINVPADYGQSVWEAVWAAGQAHGLTAYGTETMHVLRAEKGFIVVGQDSDGTATPEDLGLSWAVGKTKPDFVGKRSLARPSMADPARKQLVGLLTADPTVVLEEGAQIVVTPDQAPPMRLIGHVTSSYFSATLGRSIAMAMIRGGRARMGETLYSPRPAAKGFEAAVPVQVVSPVFYDPEGARVNG